MNLTSLNRTWLAWLPALSWAGVIFLLSSRSALPEPPIALPPHTDKLIHALLYAVLASLMYGAFRAGGTTPNRAALFALVLASLYGITDELHQSTVPGRTADVWDWVADTTGAAIAVYLPAWRARRKAA
jgi:VanZ family protein